MKPIYKIDDVVKYTYKDITLLGKVIDTKEIKNQMLYLVYFNFHNITNWFLEEDLERY